MDRENAIKCVKRIYHYWYSRGYDIQVGLEDTDFGVKIWSNIGSNGYPPMR